MGLLIMRVLFVSNDIGLGGASVSLWEMLREIRHKIEARVVLPGEGRLYETLVKEGIICYIIPFERDFVERFDGSRRKDQIILSEYRAAKQIASIIRNESIQLVHTNSSVGNAGCIGAIMAGVPHVWHIRELLKEHFDADYYDSYFKRDLFGYSHLISVSKCVRDVINKRYQVASDFVYNGVNTDIYSMTCDNSTRNEFLIAGDISEGKGQWDAVRAIEILKKRGKSIHLVIIGTGTERAKWEIRKYVRIHQLERNIDVRDFTSDLNVLRKKSGCILVTSKMEALGRVTIESMLAMQFVIGADSGGTVEIIGENGKRGLLYEQGNPNSLANAIDRYLYMSEVEVDEIKARAYSFAFSVFNVRKYAEKIKGIYQSVLEDYHFDNNMILKGRITEQFETVRASYDANDGVEDTSFSSSAEMIERKWLRLENSERTLSGYLNSLGYNKIGLYGMGHFGIRLFDELDGTSVEIGFVIDRIVGHLDEVCEVRTIDDISGVDAIIVTVSSNEDSIARMLKEYTDIRILKLTDLLNAASCDCTNKRDYA